MNIYTLDLDFLSLEHAIAAFLVEGPEGYVLVESGPYSTYTHLQAALAARDVRPGDIRAVLLTHIHFDHAGAAWAFAEAGADIYVHPKGMPHLAAPERLYHSARQIYGESMDRLWGKMESIAPDKLIVPADGDMVRLAGLDFQAWYTPGHATHHIAWQCRTADGGGSVLFAGDAAGVCIDGGPVVPPCPPPDIHIEDWQASIELMRSLEVEQIYLTHFGAIQDHKTHLDALEKRLLEWAAWIYPHVAAETPTETLVPLFQEMVASELKALGVAGASLARYEAANPAFMSVAGLSRYWKKKASS